MLNQPAKLQKRLQFARKCIFCGSNANSREYFYPGWMHGLLPVGPKGTYTGEIIDQHPKTRDVSRHDKRVKPGELYSKKMRVVCRSCNNGWMSGIESVAKPILTPIIKGQEATLDVPELEIVAKWATLKSIVCEHDNPGTEVTPQVDRSDFMADQIIPSYFNIYLLSHNCSSRVGYVRTSHAVSITSGEPVPLLEGRAKNTQQISIIIGSAMLHINAARVDGLMIENHLHIPAVVSRRIWPPNISPLNWPADPVLSCSQMRELAYSMDKITALSRTKWGGALPVSPV